MDKKLYRTGYVEMWWGTLTYVESVDWNKAGIKFESWVRTSNKLFSRVPLIKFNVLCLHVECQFVTNLLELGENRIINPSWWLTATFIVTMVSGWRLYQAPSINALPQWEGLHVCFFQDPFGFSKGSFLEQGLHSTMFHVGFMHFTQSNEPTCFVFVFRSKHYTQEQSPPVSSRFWTVTITSISVDSLPASISCAKKMVLLSWLQFSLIRESVVPLLRKET